MIRECLDKVILENGYAKIPSNVPQFTVYFFSESTCVNVLHFIDFEEKKEVTQEQNFQIKQKIMELFRKKGFQEIHILTLVLCSSAEQAKPLCGSDSFCWIIDKSNNRLLIYENQVNDFYGMKRVLENALDNSESNPFSYEAAGERKMESSRYKQPIDFKKLPLVTGTIVVLNIVVFLICFFTGDWLYDMGSISLVRMLPGAGGEYYTLLTSLFLHADTQHLFSNMLILYYIGIVVEKYFGHTRYGIIYLVAGIGGNIFSICYEFFTKQVIFSIGASGAVFGIMGALLVLVIIHKGHLEQITLNRLLFMILYSLYSGFVGTNINNAAHIGGFLFGVAAAFILWIISKRKLHFS